MTDLFGVIHEDDDLLVVNKPAGLVCHPTKGDERSSLISRLRLYLGPGSEPRLINRLDRETGGLVLAGKNPATAGELGRLLEGHGVRKTYLAIVDGRPPDSGRIDAPLGRDTASVVAIKDTVVAGGSPAVTGFTVLRRFQRDTCDHALLQVHPESGRKHQIRIHLSHAGHPIVGDKIYGGDERLYLDFVTDRLTDEQRARLRLPCHALHASGLRFAWRGRDWRLEAPPEDWFLAFAGLPESPAPDLLNPP